jgi:anaerobic ribonucleoside-triphosphate reductase activating protein
MRYSGLQIVFQEIPNEISLAIHITGCQLKCKGCHSSDLWSSQNGIQLDLDHFEQLIAKYSNYISCILFMGGEWDLALLMELIHCAKKYGKKVALYTGLELLAVPEVLLRNLDYIKYGPYISELGGLNSIKTNQRLIHLKTNTVLNSFFREDINDQIKP